MVRGDEPGHLVAHWSALHALFCGATAEAIGLYLRAARVHRAHGHHAAHLTCLFQLAMAQTYDGRRDDALKACARVVEMAGQHGERSEQGLCAVGLGARPFPSRAPRLCSRRGERCPGTDPRHTRRALPHAGRLVVAHPRSAPSVSEQGGAPDQDRAEADSRRAAGTFVIIVSTTDTSAMMPMVV